MHIRLAIVFTQLQPCMYEVLYNLFHIKEGWTLFKCQSELIYISIRAINSSPGNEEYTDASSCYHTPKILISDFINLREKQE